MSKKKTPKLKSIVKELSLNQTIMAEFAGISHSAYKNKVSDKNDIYFFTDQEYASVLDGIRTMAGRMLDFCKDHDKVQEFKKYTSKK